MNSASLEPKNKFKSPLTNSHKWKKNNQNCSKKKEKEKNSHSSKCAAKNHSTKQKFQHTSSEIKIIENYLHSNSWNKLKAFYEIGFICVISADLWLKIGFLGISTVSSFILSIYFIIYSLFSKSGICIEYIFKSCFFCSIFTSGSYKNRWQTLSNKEPQLQHKRLYKFKAITKSVTCIFCFFVSFG